MGAICSKALKTGRKHSADFGDSFTGQYQVLDSRLAGVYSKPLWQRLNPSSLINMQLGSCITHLWNVLDWIRP
jgi:hypothetical protein